MSANGQWVGSAGEARHFDNRLVAHRAAGNDPDVSVVHTNMVDWLKPALMTVSEHALVAR